MSDEICEVVITAPDADWLAGFTRRLVEDRLCASGHNISGIRSIYRWQGDIYDRGEARVALHTRVDLVPAIVERTGREHPYQVACVVATPIIAGNPEYVRWVLEQTTTEDAAE
jgi:periplasmic divalent cation tolerance protein